MWVDSIRYSVGVAGRATDTARIYSLSANKAGRSLGAVTCALAAAMLHTEGSAQVSSVLIEACSMLEPASKRIECLEQANQTVRGNAVRPAPGYQPPANFTPNYLQSAPTPNTSYSAPSGQTCFVGPRGGTYTITKSGKKNYGGC